MKKHPTQTGSSRDPITNIQEAAPTERTRMNQELLIALAHAWATNEKAQRRFRNAVLYRLSRIETILTEVQGAQLVQLWPPGQVSDEERTKLVSEVEGRVSAASEQLGLKMVRYIYGPSEELDVPRDRRRKWSDWQI